MNIRVLFISDKLLDPDYRDMMRLPMEFVCFAIADGRMYTHEFKVNTFVAQGLKKHGNNKVYGAVYVLKDDFYHLRTLDSHYLCSMSVLHRNHTLDLSHRIIADVIPITFDSLQELDTLRYNELEPIKVEMYVGNLNHTKLKKRINQKRSRNYRVTNGVDENLLKQIRRVQGERT